MGWILEPAAKRARYWLDKSDNLVAVAEEFIPESNRNHAAWAEAELERRGLLGEYEDALLAVFQGLSSESRRGLDFKRWLIRASPAQRCAAMMVAVREAAHAPVGR